MLLFCPKKPFFCRMDWVLTEVSRWKRRNCKPRLILFRILAIIIIHLHRGLLEAELKEPTRSGNARFQQVPLSLFFK